MAIRLFLLAWLLVLVAGFTPQHIERLRNDTAVLFDHAWRGYMAHGFPADEVRPELCVPYGPDFTNVDNIVRNDATGNVSLTVLDNIDSLVMFERWDDLEFVLGYLKSQRHTLFDQDTVVQVFESTIRLLGGLLSSHLLLSDLQLPSPRFTAIAGSYDGFLLEMAHDLGTRLVAAYKTASGIPLPRINLRRGLSGVPKRLQKENCLSGAATPILEFTLLSRLTGDPQFEHYSKQTFWKLWDSRLVLDLLPMLLDPHTNKWRESITGVGALVDSFYEYAAKAAIVLNDNELWSVFKASYRALLTHSSQSQHLLFANVNVDLGFTASTWIDSLGAFWPGLQVLTGQLTDAVRTHLVYLKLWDYYDLIPERWNHVQAGSGLVDDALPLEWYPLRPEFIESTYYLYRATRDPMYLNIGVRVLELLQTRYMAPCGLRGLQDIRTGQFQDRMESFVMSETLKYLYLLFDVDDKMFLHDGSMALKGWVFSTEAHPLWLSRNQTRSASYEHSHISPGLVQSLWAKIKSVLAPSEPVFYDFPGIETTDLVLESPLDSRFEVCEATPAQMQTTAAAFMRSHFYTWTKLFHADHTFNKTLVRPPYLPHTNIIEIEPSFFDTYSMFAGSKLQSARVPTTNEHDLFLGDKQAIRSQQVSSLHHSKGYQDAAVLDGDLWVPDFNSLRLSLEVLEPGKVDSYNNDITEEYIEEIRPDDFSTQGVSKKQKNIYSALRIKRINGLDVPPGSIVWTSEFDIFDEDVLDVASDGRLVLRGQVVENLMVWYG